MSSRFSQQVLAIIPARGGSKGIPRKNVRLLNGRPLIEYTCDAARQSRLISRAIVSTDCSEIADVARQSGVEVPFLRPPELAADGSPTIDVIDHALRWIQGTCGDQYEVVVLLQPTAPLRTAVHIDEALTTLVGRQIDAVVSVTRVPAHYHPAWQFRVQGDELIPWSGGTFHDVPSQRQMLSPSYTRNGAIYAFQRQTLQRDRSIYGTCCAPYVMSSEVSVNIDTEDDWRMAESYLRRQDSRHAA